MQPINTLAAGLPAAGNKTTALASDAVAFSRALQNLLRLYQFRDRERICCYDITVTECYALEALVHSGPMTVNQLATALHLDKSTTSRVVRTLEEKNYVDRASDPQDRRALQLRSSASGTELATRIQEDLEQRYERLLRDLDPQVRGAVIAVLQRLHAEALCLGAPELGCTTC